jgi:hypothetical protein
MDCISFLSDRVAIATMEATVLAWEHNLWGVRLPFREQPTIERLGATSP